MILKALYDYYHRCAESEHLPMLGMEAKEIGFVIVLSKEGKFLRIENLVDGGKGKIFYVKKSVGRSSGIRPNYLYDSPNYVLGLFDNRKDKKKTEGRIKAEFESFKDQISAIFSKFPNDDDLKALTNFYTQDIEHIRCLVKADPLWATIEKSFSKKYANFSFRIDGDRQIIAEKRHLLHLNDNEDIKGSDICLITGNGCSAITTTSATMIPGSQAKAKLVSFQVSSGYDSFGKAKGDNAPISLEAEFAYTTALKHLLRSGSPNKFLLGSTTFVFWASSDTAASKETEKSLFDLLGIPDNNKDNPNQNVEKAQKVFRSIFSGVLKTELNDKLFILGMKPNSARIYVSYWAEIPLRDFAQKILQHFKDMEIIDNRNEKKPYYGMYKIIGAVTLGGKATDATPNLPEAVARSIFQGLPYPQTLFSACIRRIRADEGNVGIARAAILKAYLNRINDNKNKKISIMLDKENTNIGYLCGRLFAVMDNLQYAANKQDSIRSSYMNAASSTPASVFPTILKLSNSHYDKTAKDNKGLAIYFDRQKQEIMSMIQSFPETLNLNDQSRFFLGYYHQKNERTENNTNTNE